MPRSAAGAARRGHRVGAMLAAGALLLAAGGCGKPALSPYEQVIDRPFAVRLPSGGAPSPAPRITVVHSGIFLPLPPRFALAWRNDDRKFVPPLDAWLRDSSGSRRTVVVIRFADPYEFPRMPIEGMESTDSATAAAALHAASGLVDSMRTLREALHRPKVARLRHKFGARSVRTHVLSQSVTADLALAEIAGLGRWSSVQSVQLVERGTPPPEDCLPAELPSNATVAYPGEARAWLGTDPYRGAGMARGHLVLFDTGVNTAHDVLAPLLEPSPQTGSHRLVSFDCLGDPECAGTNPPDLDVAGYGHGSKSASLLVGLGRPDDRYADGLDDRYSGVTTGWLNALRVFHADGTHADFDADAFANAAERALKLPHAIILSETQDNGGLFGSATDADQLYASGAAVIAPVGNRGEVNGSPIGSPAISARALAVGARLTTNREKTADAQLSAVVPLLRNKPDLQAPTNTVGAHGDLNACFDGFLKTSGAAPYAAAAARIVRNLFASAQLPMSPAQVDPGQVYATLLALGTHDRPYPRREGVGPISFPSGGMLYGGKSRLGSNQQVTVTIPLSPASGAKCRVAIWWADPRPGQLWPGALTLIAHRDLDLAVLFPGETEPRTSIGEDGVFETVTKTLRADKSGLNRLVIGIQARNTGFARGTVYWAAVVSGD